MLRDFIFIAVYRSGRDRGHNRVLSACEAFVAFVFIRPIFEAAPPAPGDDEKIQAAKRRSETIEDWSEVLDDH